MQPDARNIHRRKSATHSAYTLVEVLVATVVLGILMISLFAGLAGGYAIINTFRQDLRATQILTQKTEFVRLCNWTQLNNLPSTFQDYYAFKTASQPSTNVIYYGTLTVGPATNIADTVSYKSDVRLITIGLTWTNSLGSHQIVHNRQMQTLVAYHGLVNYIGGHSFLQQ